MTEADGQLPEILVVRSLASILAVAETKPDLVASELFRSQDVSMSTEEILAWASLVRRMLDHTATYQATTSDSLGQKILCSIDIFVNMLGDFAKHCPDLQSPSAKSKWVTRWLPLAYVPAF